MPSMRTTHIGVLEGSGTSGRSSVRTSGKLSLITRSASAAHRPHPADLRTDNSARARLGEEGSGAVLARPH
eukprot:4825960-Pleurochrysis_carterae.AAC.4